MQVSLKANTNFPEDVITNTFYLDTDPVLGGGPTDYQQLASDAADLWSEYRTYPEHVPLLQIKAYDMSDAEPRQPRAFEQRTVVSSAACGPREVALCLSYWSDRNLPRFRGRMYIGPWQAGACQERPEDGARISLQTLALGIADLGGVNVQWVQHSPTTGHYKTVKHWWVDNEWDTMRSRGLKGTARLEGDVNG